MEDDTATGFEDVTPAPEEGQAETTTVDPAENDTTEVQTDQETETEETTDPDLAWAKKKGIDVHDDPKLAKMLRNADRKVSDAGKKAKTSLQDAVDKTAGLNADDDVVTELQSKYRMLATKFAATQYYLDNPDDKDYDSEASAILQEEAVADPEFARALGRNLPKLFALAKARHSEESVANAKEEGRKEERRTLAGKQRASATPQAATTNAPSKDKDAFEEGFDNPWGIAKR